ncbi:hypothetical protein [Seonamhaeicola marinus]|uniref:Uncharacterized protein n=1 Tax=Seonamhaeicola marinus TaxID=1912246 RepID=A0A5D0IKT4_9FLAO|nr:hypothetical protein [Seonamhaeicola marinus]TYA84166.1 hypothetical protein FUA24_05805 [Seonamhaeicola marinus]
MKKTVETIVNSKIKQQNIDLVDGTFNISDASDIINAVLDVKINHHKIKRLSIKEGDINDLCEYDTNRINELIKAKEDAKTFFKDLRYSGKKLRINGLITIEALD